MQPIAPKNAFEAALLIGVGLGLGFSLFVLVAGLTQPVLDLHNFRQAQTALTIDWLTRGGPWFGYETPVLGHPWTIPFEFPLYQWLVAPLHAMGVPLDPAARIVNWVMFALALVLGALTMRTIGAPRSLALAFLVLALFSPLYAYWSRTVMIESTALALSALFLFGLARHLKEPRLTSFALLVVGAILAALVKITTFFAFAAAGALIVAAHLAAMAWRERQVAPVARAAWAPTAAVGVSLIALHFWVAYADALKTLNPIGVLYTSDNLSRWNFGTLAQRLDPSTWSDIFFGRAAIDSVGSMWVVVAAAALALALRKRLIWVAAGIALYLAPMLVFTNLHIVHNYYQYANAVFLVLAVAAAVHGLSEIKLPGGPRVAQAGALTALALVVAFQVAALQREFWPAIIANHEGDRAIQVSQRIQARTSEDEVAIVAGYDWNSIIAYLSERRVITLPEAAAPMLGAYPIETFTGGRAIGIIVDCEANSASRLKPLLRELSADLTAYALGECIAYDRVGPQSIAERLAPPPVFRDDPNLRPLSLPALAASATGEVQFLALIEEASPSGEMVPGIFAHANTDLTTPVPAGVRELVVNYGMRPPSYQSGGTTKGVCFSIEAGPAQGETAEIWRHCLTPREVAADRGMHEAAVELPAGAERIVLRTHADDTSWGWSYWANPRVG